MVLSNGGEEGGLRRSSLEVDVGTPRDQLARGFSVAPRAGGDEGGASGGLEVDGRAAAEERGDALAVAEDHRGPKSGVSCSGRTVGTCAGV